MTYDQAQSPRLGQRTPVESTYVRMFSGDEIPEAAWLGQIIYRNDTQNLQIYNGNAWESVVGGAAGTLTFVGPTPPVSQSIGDIWFDTAHGNKMYRAAMVGADAIAVGEWEDLTPVAAVGATIYRQDTPPVTANNGDLWYETDNKNKPYVLVSGLWVAVQDGTIADAQSTANTANTNAGNAQTTANTANTNAGNAQTLAASKNQSFYTTSPPTAITAGDIWFDTDDGFKQYRASAPGTGSWQLVQDALIPQTVTTANGKNTIYYATTVPTVPVAGSSFADNDLWFDTSNGYAISIYTAGAWTPAPYGGAALSVGAVSAREINSSYAYVGALRAEQILTGNISFGIGIAALLRTPGAPGSPGVEIDPTGLRIIGPNDPDDTTTLQPGLSSFKGSAEVTTLLVKGSGDGTAATLRQNSELSRGAKLTISNSVTSPSAAPIPVIDWQPVPLTGYDLSGWTGVDLYWDASLSRWLVFVSGVVVGQAAGRTLSFRADGTFDAQLGPDFIVEPGQVLGGVRIPGVNSYYIWRAGDSSLYLSDQSANSIGFNPIASTAQFSMCYDGTNLIIGELHMVAGSSLIRLYKYTTSAVAGTTLVTNGTFEANITGWTANLVSASRYTTAPITGAGSLIATTNLTFPGTVTTASPITVVAGNRYTIDAKLRAQGALGGVCSITLSWLNAANAVVKTDIVYSASVGASTVNTSAARTAPTGATKVNIIFGFPKMDNAFLVDDVALYTSPNLNLVSATQEIEVDSVTTAPCNGLYVGNGDFGAKYYVMASASSGGNTAIVAPDSTRIEDMTRTFPLPAQSPVGIGYDGTAFWTLGSNFTLYKHEPGNKFTTESAIWKAVSTYRDTVNSFETSLSPMVSFVMKRRARVTLTTAGLNSTGSGDPNASAVYLTRVTTTPVRTDYHYQGNAVGNKVAVTTANFAAAAPPDVSSGASPPSFPSSSPAELSSAKVDAAGPLIDLNGDGSGRAGPMSWNTSAVLTNTPVPVATMMMYAGSGAPAGWAICDGSAVSRPIANGGSSDTYKALYTTIGTTFGIGNGSSTFNLPDLRSRVPIGAGTYASRGVSDGLSEASRTLQHAHTNSHTHPIPAQPAGNTWVTPNTGSNLVPKAVSFDGHAHGGDTNTASAATGTSTNDAIAYQALNFIIKY